MDYIQIISHTGNILNKIWHYEILSVEDNDIAVGNIIIASIFFIFAIRLSNKLTSIMHQKLKSTYNCDESTATSAGRTAYYALNFLALMMTMQIAHIPVSSFAFIGGSLAIAVGLGAQNLISNFISSILIIFEQPIKIGDVIEVDGTLGTVTALHSRCTILSTEQGTQILIPNSIIMQKKLTNWTLDNKLLTKSVEITITRTEKNKPQYYLDKINKAVSSTEKESHDLFVIAVDSTTIKLQLQLHYHFNSMNSGKTLLNNIIIAIDSALHSHTYNLKAD